MEETLITFETAKLAKEKGFVDLKVLITMKQIPLIEIQKFKNLHFIGVMIKIL